MAFDAARPRYTLPLAGKDYALLGTMDLIEAVESALQKGFVQITLTVMTELSTSELVRLLSAILTASGNNMSVREVSALLWERVGVAGDNNRLLRAHLYCFMSICLAPPEKREEKAKTAGELIGKLETSRGSNTSDSASAS
jgi:hypothetical protein